VRGKEYSKVEVKKGKPRWRKIMKAFMVKRTLGRSEIREENGAREM
jgi:hypothetical protein